MGKKHWIYLKRGLSEDPKHRQRMGMAVWCFLHICDRADFDTGIVRDWKDEDEAESMGVSVRTLRDWRQKLEREDYISCTQNQYSQDIKIYNWINPRDYSSRVLNPRPKMDFEGDKKSAPLEFQGDTRGDTQGNRKSVTPTLYPKNQLINDEDQESVARRTGVFSTLFQDNITLITPLLADAIQDAVLDYPDESWYAPAFKIAVENNARSLRYVLTILKSWKEHHFGWTPQFKKNGKNGNGHKPPVKQRLTEAELAEAAADAARQFGVGG